MKKLFFVAVIMMASISAFAQHAPGSLTLQPRIGFSAADFNNTSDTKARVGLVVGPEFEYTISDRFSVAGGINYSQQGAELDKTEPARKDEIIEAAEILMKYSGYISRERLIADKMKRLEDIRIKGRFDYSSLQSLSTECRQKLIKHDPETLAEASRIPGVSPSDINVLLVLLNR